jgi:hypothetical protein
MKGKYARQKRKNNPRKLFYVSDLLVIASQNANIACEQLIKQSPRLTNTYLSIWHKGDQ